MWIDLAETKFLVPDKAVISMEDMLRHIMKDLVDTWPDKSLDELRHASLNVAEALIKTQRRIEGFKP